MSTASNAEQHFADDLPKRQDGGMIATNSEKTKQLRSKALYTSRILKAGFRDLQVQKKWWSERDSNLRSGFAALSLDVSVSYR
jgi:hypothetical protein